MGMWVSLCRPPESTGLDEFRYNQEVLTKRLAVLQEKIDQCDADAASLNARLVSRDRLKADERDVLVNLTRLRDGFVHEFRRMQSLRTVVLLKITARENGPMMQSACSILNDTEKSQFASAEYIERVIDKVQTELNQTKESADAMEYVHAPPKTDRELLQDLRAMLPDPVAAPEPTAPPPAAAAPKRPASPVVPSDKTRAPNRPESRRVCEPA